MTAFMVVLSHRSVSKALSRSDPNDTGPATNLKLCIKPCVFELVIRLRSSPRHTWLKTSSSRVLFRHRSTRKGKQIVNEVRLQIVVKLSFATFTGNFSMEWVKKRFQLKNSTLTDIDRQPKPKYKSVMHTSKTFSNHDKGANRKRFRHFRQTKST